MGQQYSEMKCPSATAIFGLGAESMKVGLAKRCCCGGCPREKKKGWHCFTKGVAVDIREKKRVGTILPKVLLRWVPSRLSPLVVAAVSAAAAAAADDDDDDGGGGGDDDDEDDETTMMMLFFRDLKVASRTFRTTLLALQVSAEQSVGWMTAMPSSTNPAYCTQIGPKL